MNRRVIRATGPAAIATALTPVTAFQLEEIRLHLDAGGAAGDLTVTLDSAAGATYDTVFLTQAMLGITDLVWQPTRPYIFSAGDVINVAYAANVADYGLEIYFSGI